MNKTEPTKPQQQPPGKKRARFLLRLLIYPLALLVILLLGAFLFLQTGAARGMAKTYIEQAAAQYLQADLQIAKISGSLLFDISLEQVRISREGDVIFAAQRVSAGYIPLLLLTRVFMLNEVEIDGMVLNLVRETDGRLNIAPLIPAGEAPETSESSPLSFTTLVSRISILNSTVILVDRQTAAVPERRISDIRLAAGLKLSPDGRVSARIIDLALTIDKPAVRLAGLNGRFSFIPENHRLDIENIRVRLKETDVTVNGRLDLDPAGIQFGIQTAMKALSLPEIGQIFSIPALDRGRITGTLQVNGTPNRFTHKAHLSMDAVSLSSSGSIEQTDSGSFGVDIAAAVRNLNPAALPLAALNRISGDINADIRLQGTNLSRPERRGLLSIDLKPSRISGYKLAGGGIEATFDAGGIVLKESFLAGPLGRITVRRAVADIFDPFRSGRLSLDASLQDLDPAVSGRADLSGKVNLDVTATALLPGPTDKRFDPAAITAQVSVDIGPSRIQSIDLERGRIQAAWNGREIEIKMLKLSSTGNRLAISGLLTPGDRDSRLAFNADLPDLQQAVPLIFRFFPERFPPGSELDMQGRLTVSGEFKGWWDRPELSAAVNGSGFRYNHVSAQSFNAKGTYQGLPDGFRATTDSYTENATVNGTRIARLDLGLQLREENARVVIALQHEKGLTLNIKGRVDSWLQPTKKISIDAFRFFQVKTARDPAAPLIEEIVNDGPLRLTLTPDGIEVAALKLVSKEAGLSLTGRLIADNRIDAALSLNRLDLKRLPRFIEKQDEFSGILSTDLELTGTLARPILHSRLRLKDASGFEFSLSDLDVSLDYRADHAVFKAIGYHQQTKILDISGEVGLLCSLQPFKFQFQNNEFKVAVVARGLKLSALPIPKKEGFNFDGTLALDARVNGDLSAPNFNGNMSVRDGFFAPEDKDPRDYAFSDLKIDFRYTAAIADFSAALYRRKQKLLDLSGRIPLELSLAPFLFKPMDEGFSLDAAAQDLKLSMLPIPRKPGVDFDARLNIDATATGSLSRPIISGNLYLQEGFLTLLNPSLSYETVRAHVDFSPKGIVIQEFLMEGDSEGALNIKGRIDMEGLKPTAFNMRLTGENVFVPYEKAVAARIRPDLKLTGTPQKPFLSGILTITEGCVNLDQISAQRPAEIQILSAGPGKKAFVDISEEPTAAKDLLRPLAANVMVAAPKNVWLKGQGVKTEMAGEVNLKKEAEKPFILVGSLHTLRGTFDFQSKLFKITRGNIDFFGMEKLNPNLDIEAETRIARVTIIVKISGTAERMILTFDSEPSMDRTDIISYLVFGKPASELNQQQNLNAEQAALNLTGRLAANELKKILGDAFSLDVLTLESGGGDITEGGIAVGKYVTPEVFVLYRHRFKVDEPDQVEVTYEINRNFSIETQLGDEKTTGLDFVWDFDF